MNKTAEPAVGEEAGDFWLSHVVAAKDFIGTDGEYCQRNEISHKTFQARKKKYGFTRPMKARRLEKFVKVKAEPEQVAKPVVQAIASNKVLPDAKWMAEFVVALLAKQ